jgi:hypothetical protein
LRSSVLLLSSRPDTVAASSIRHDATFDSASTRSPVGDHSRRGLNNAGDVRRVLTGEALERISSFIG